MARVLVLDGLTPSCLAITRTLGRKGILIDIGETTKPNLASYSKYSRNFFKYSCPIKTPEKFVKDVLNIVQNGNYDGLIPTTEETTLLISKHQDEFKQHTNVFLVDYDTLHMFADKGKTVKFANGLGIPTPKTYFPEDADIKVIKKSANYPLLIRPRISSGSRGIVKIEDPAAFDEHYTSIKSEYGEPIVQEYVNKTGYTTACVLLDENQKLIAGFTYERVREYPLNAGPTVVGVSTTDKKILDRSVKLLKNSGWKGIAEVEYILDEDGNPLLLEVNPRFWTPVNLAIDSGVDFPYLLYRLMTGNKPKPINDYKKGVVYRWVLPMQILWLLNYDDKISGLKEFFEFRNEKSSYGILSLEDPFPIVGSMAQSLDFIMEKEKRKMVLR